MELSGVRSSWLMLARNSLLYSFARCSSADFAVSTACDLRERVLLMLEHLRLFLELGVDLLELGLLRLELRPRLAQRPALLLELLVVDAQLLLRVCSSSACCCVSCSSSSSRAILGGAHRNGDRLRNRAEKLLLRRIDFAEEAELHHGVDSAVDARGRDQQLAPARRGPIPEPIGR